MGKLDNLFANNHNLLAYNHKCRTEHTWSIR